MKVREAITLITLLTAVIWMTGCGTKDNSGPAPARNTTYILKVKDVLGVTGTVTFTETSGTVATVDISLTGAPSGTHPAELCMHTAIEGGAVVIELNPIDATGKSSTAVTSLTYTQLIAYDGFIKVVKSSSEPGVILAQGDIGGNAMTGTSKTYTLDTVGTYGVSGTALFEKRVNGTTLLTLTVTGIIANGVYPATINLGSITTVGGGPVAKTLNHVAGATGKSYTNIRSLDNGMAITYDNWLVYSGYINIYQTAVGLGNIICHGNIGSNRP